MGDGPATYRQSRDIYNNRLGTHSYRLPLESIFITANEVKRDEDVSLSDDIGVINFMKVKEGKFGAFMEINLVNKGPVTFNFKT